MVFLLQTSLASRLWRRASTYFKKSRVEYYASSPYKKELAGYGGWGGSSNAFQAIRKAKSFKRNQLNLYVNSRDSVPFQEKYKGMSLYIVNLSKDTFFFEAQDSRLYLKLQAKDQNGRWRDIEYLPSSWCGNSYHQVFLPPKNLWSFAMPVYEGAFVTQLRARLSYKEDSKQEKSQIIYSNEFESSINPAQFWRKPGYTSGGLMDPYYD